MKTHVLLAVALAAAALPLVPDAEATRCTPGADVVVRCAYRDVTWRIEEGAVPYCDRLTGDPYCLDFPPLP